VAKNVVLKVNGNEVRMNDFVRRALTSVVGGFVGILDDVPEKPGSIEIVIQAEGAGGERKG